MIIFAEESYKMRKKSVVSMLAAGILLVMSQGAFAADDLILATGGTTGTYYAVGNAMQSILNPVLEQSFLTVTSTGGSKSNIQMLADGSADLAIVQNDILDYAYNGTELFSTEGAYDDVFGAVAGLYDEHVQIVTTDPAIITVADLKGKKVSVGDVGSGTEYNAKQILEAYDLSFSDLDVVNTSFGDAAEGLKSGDLDAAFIVAGAPTTAVISLAFTNDIYLVQLDEEHIGKLQENYDFFTEAIIPAGIYKGLDEDVTTVAVRATLIASNDASEDAVYELLDAIFRNQETLIGENEKFSLLSVDSASDASLGITVPFHPGAMKFYEEQGITLE